jgi:hypothetical protein
VTTARILALQGRLRVAVALVLFALAGIAERFDLLPDDAVVRMFAGGLLFALAALVFEVAPRLRLGRIATLAGPVAEFWAAAVTVALLERYADLAPALFLLPIATLALVLREIDTLAFAALAAALLLESRALRAPDLEDLLIAGGWALLYLAWALIAGRAGSALRRATRRHDVAEDALPTLAAASSYDEIARITFAYLDHVSDGSGDAPAALLVDADAIGTLSAVATRGLTPEARARLRVAANAPSLPAPFERALLVPLRDGAQLVGLATLADARSGTEGFAQLVPLAAAAVVRVRASTRARRLAPAGTADASAWLADAARDALGAIEARVVRARSAGPKFADLVASARRSRVSANGGRAALQVGGRDLWLLVERAEPLGAGDLRLLAALAEEAAHLRERSGAEARVAQLAARMDSSDNETAARLVDALRLAIETNQPQLAGSGMRVGAIADAVAGKLGHSTEQREALHIAALLRDVGQLGIDRAVLDRQGELSKVERQIVERHPLLGEAILSTIPYLAPAARIVRAHHERWDGSGYPYGLSGTDIPDGARVLAVADAYVAMTTPRAHRSALRPSEALGIILERRGRDFEPAAVDTLVSLAGTGAVILP